MKWKALVAAAALAAGLGGIAIAQTAPYPSPTPVRGEHASTHNIQKVFHRTERLIDQLQGDQHDYGGHRVNAIRYLQQARTELAAAVAYDQQHPGQ